MKLLYYLLALLLVFSCQQKDKTDASNDSTKKGDHQKKEASEDPEEQEEIAKEYDYYAGTIGLYGEDVLMEVTTENNSITGRYWYLKHGKEIQLEGTTSARGDEWQLKESVKKVLTGEMTLKVDGKNLTGQWYPPVKASNFQEVNLKKVYHSDAGKIDPVFEEYVLTKTITVYNGEDDEEEEADDELRLVRMGDYILFQYFVIGYNVHTGHINGLAKFQDKNKAIYFGEEACQLSFIFNQNEVSVEEEESCSYYRGMRAYFGGTLKKKRTY